VERVSRADRATVVASMLMAEPLPQITAITHTGIFQPMPTTVPLRGHRVIAGARSALDLVVPDDRRLIIEAWGNTLATGGSAAPMCTWPCCHTSWP